MSDFIRFFVSSRPECVAQFNVNSFNTLTIPRLHEHIFLPQEYSGTVIKVEYSYGYERDGKISQLIDITFDPDVETMLRINEDFEERECCVKCSKAH